MEEVCRRYGNVRLCKLNGLGELGNGEIAEPRGGEDAEMVGPIADRCRDRRETSRAQD